MLLGNHRDAWSYGAADALSGQAAMLEIGRALGAMKKKGTSRQSFPMKIALVCGFSLYRA